MQLVNWPGFPRSQSHDPRWFGRFPNQRKGIPILFGRFPNKGSGILRLFRRFLNQGRGFPRLFCRFLNHRSGGFGLFGRCPNQRGRSVRLGTAAVISSRAQTTRGNDFPNRAPVQGPERWERGIAGKVHAAFFWFPKPGLIRPKQEREIL